MTLHLHDSATRTQRPFVPLVPGRVGMYVCGWTVQSAPHIGHMRMAVAFDVLVRWLTRSGYDVTYIRNVTDIDDKILTKSAEADVPWWAWSQRYEREFTDACEALGTLPPTYEPRATGHVTEMVELMERLVEAGHAYSTGDGDVWFDVRSWPAYGALTRQQLEDSLVSAQDADADESAVKRDPRDFALWKGSKPDDPTTASWPTPFGRGRPGWHLECSAMAERYLGPTFDLHGGGLDLRFPHHENELAQSQAAGSPFARLWMHSAWVTQGGAKMSKSLGNSLLVDSILAEHRPAVLRFALAVVHYRSMLEYGPETLAEAEATWNRIAGFVERASELVGAVEDDEVDAAELPRAFVSAMDDDLNVPAALAYVHEHLRLGNTALADGDGRKVRAEMVQVRAMLDVLGLDPARWAARQGGGAAHRAERSEQALDTLVRAQLQERAQARNAKDWATADAVRDRLVAAGIVVEDSAQGARWSLAQDQED